eukprot:TRINITY_DN17959_c0_g1_i3.p1 TRINITY_DN17959_c0_g1~~TRINITY_DN17959_c0_g1_i3.p1  ORF type:complete len:242 (+),score=49.09 TRINITY_DN17959_c0_g1_i3:240-965(+)
MDVIALNAELSKLRQQLSSLGETHARDIANRDSELQTKLTAIERLREEIRQLKTQKQAPTERIIERVVPQQSPADTLNTEALKRKLEKNIAALETSIAEKDSQIAKIAKETQDKLIEKDTQIRRLETELGRVQSGKDAQIQEQLKAKDLQIAKLERALQEQLQAKDGRIMKLEQELQEKSQGKDLIISRLEKEVDRVQSGKDAQMQEKLKGKDAHIARLEKEIGRAVQQECRDRSRMPSSA